MATAIRRRTLGRYLAGVVGAIGLSGCAASPLIAERGPPTWVPPVPWSVEPNAEPVLPIPKAAAEQPVSGQFASEALTTDASVAPATLRMPIASSEPAPAIVPPTPAIPESAVGLPITPPAPGPAKDVTFNVRGRVQADSISVTQSAKDKLLYGNFDNAVGFRRARIGAEGTANENTRWVAEWDFASGSINFKDMYVAINHLPFLGEVRVGRFFEPFSLEAATSTNLFPLVERSSQFALDPARNWGVAIFSHTEDQKWIIQAGAFKSGSNHDTGGDIGDGNDMAYDARVVWLPWFDDGEDSFRLWHIGGAVSQRYAKDDMVTYNQGPQSNLLSSGDDQPFIPFVPTISIPATQNQLFNVQTALALGPLSFQAEWSATHVDQIGGGPVNFQGAYVLASYFLTGEHRNYNRDFGTFLPPTVRQPFACVDGAGGIRGPGAWELVARLAYVNFDSPNLAPGANGLPVGNRLTTLSLGVNWYLNDNARVMLDYIHAVPVDPTFGSSTVDTFTVRTAIFW